MSDDPSTTNNGYEIPSEDVNAMNSENISLRKLNSPVVMDMKDSNPKYAELEEEYDNIIEYDFISNDYQGPWAEKEKCFTAGKKIRPLPGVPGSRPFDENTEKCIARKLFISRRLRTIIGARV